MCFEKKETKAIYFEKKETQAVYFEKKKQNQRVLKKINSDSVFSKNETILAVCF